MTAFESFEKAFRDMNNGLGNYTHITMTEADLKARAKEAPNSILGYIGKKFMEAESEAAIAEQEATIAEQREEFMRVAGIASTYISHLASLNAQIYTCLCVTTTSGIDAGTLIGELKTQRQFYREALGRVEIELEEMLEHIDPEDK